MRNSVLEEKLFLPKKRFWPKWLLFLVKALASKIWFTPMNSFCMQDQYFQTNYTFSKKLLTGFNCYLYREVRDNEGQKKLTNFLLPELMEKPEIEWGNLQQDPAYEWHLKYQIEKLSEWLAWQTSAHGRFPHNGIPDWTGNICVI